MMSFRLFCFSPAAAAAVAFKDKYMYTLSFFLGMYKPPFSYCELHTEKMNWRNKGSSVNSAVILRFKGGPAGEDIDLTGSGSAGAIRIVT